MRVIAVAALAVAVSGCTVKTFDDATKNVNEGFALGQQLRDRCQATQDIDHCKDWIAYKRSEEAEMRGFDYEKALNRWIAKGPY